MNVIINFLYYMIDENSKKLMRFKPRKQVIINRRNIMNLKVRK